MFSHTDPENTVISPNFLVSKFFEKTQFPHSFGRFAEVHPEPSQTYKTELFTKIVNSFQLLTIFVKSSILDV